MCKRLEELSDKIRQGVPVSLSEALEVIEYQSKLEKERQDKASNSLVGRFMRWIRVRWMLGVK